MSELAKLIGYILLGLVTVVLAIVGVKKLKNRGKLVCAACKEPVQERKQKYCAKCGNLLEGNGGTIRVKPEPKKEASQPQARK